MRRVRRKVVNKEKVFGCDLLEHLAASGQEIPQVLRNCSEFIELHGIVDGIYRLSGVSSNIQKLRSEFDSEGSPDLNKDLYLQDIHCVSSLCKAYFRELPNPLLTYQLYDKFAEAVAIQLEEERLVKIRDVLKELPSLHHRTLEFLMRHLVRVASHSSETNMHSRNLAIVWAPNLLRSKDIEASGFNGTAAFMEVRVQSIVVEFILTHVSQLFPEEGTSLERRKSLPSPTAMCNQEEPIFRSVQPLSNYGNISPGDGPLPIRPYHAIIEGTDKRKGSLKGRKWMSIFNIGGRFHDPRRRNKNSTKEKDRPVLRPARSMDSLSSPSYPKEASRHPAQRPPSSVISPLAGPSPQGGPEVTASPGAVHGSGYAVTYRRGTGVISGGGGTQGTYSLLDPEGLGASAEEGKLHHSRSPGIASKRRAVMHITGPHLVTVPLHITSNLALGVLQGGGGDRVIHCRDMDGGARVEGKGEGEKQERKDGKEMERKEEGGGGVAVKDVKEDKNNGEDVKAEGLREEKGNPEVEGGGAEEKAEGEKEDERDEEAAREDERLKPEQEVGGRGESGEQDGKHLNYSTGEDNDEDYDDEYMEMKAAEPVAPAAPGSPTSETSACGVDSVSDVSDFLNSEEVDGDDQELSGYVQDNFDFLDHMDCGMSSQMNEFSVEPPGYEDDEYEVMEQHLPCHLLQAPAELQPPPGSASDTQTQLNSHRPLNTDVHGRHVKSLSLPYMTPPFLPAQYSSEEEAVDDDNDDEYSNDEDDMFYKSLPSGYTLDWPDDVPSPLSPLSSCTVDRVAQSQSSEDRWPEPLDVESPACNEVKDGEALEKIQSTVTPEDLLREDDASIAEDDPGDAEKSTTCCVEFPPPRTEDDDGTDTEADTKVEDEKEVVENPHSSGESSGGHFDDAADESGARVSVTFPTRRKVSCAAQGEIVGVSTEVSRKLSVGPIEQPETCGRKGEGERDEGEEGKVDEELEDRIGGAVAKEEIQENKQEEQIEGGGEGEGEEHGEKRQEVGKEQDDAQVWEEFESFIFEMIEYEESKNAEKKDASDGTAGEGKMTGDVVKVGEEEEQIGRGNIEMEKVGILSEDTKVSEEGTREEEGGVIIKTEVEKEAVEEPKEENHKDPEMQQDLETKEMHLPKKIELNDENEAGESEIRERGAIKEEERMSAHQRCVEEADSKVQKKENEDKEQPQTLSSVDEKEKRLQDVKSDIKESKESKFEESSSSSQGSETGVGRKLVISKQAPAKLYQVKSVPVVPPKPQHCRLTALSLRQQQQRERGDGDRGSVARAAAEQSKDQEREMEAKTEREKACEGEQGKDGEREDESRGRKERHVLKGGERERRRDGDEGGTRDTNRNSPLSMCFDEAVAKATMRRGREKESERERERQRDWGYEVQ